MDLSELERRIASLEHSLDSWESCLTFFTLLVVIGLIFEYWHEIKEIFDRLPKKEKLEWKHKFAVLGAFLVTVGVAGELYVEFKASGIQTDLRIANNAEFTALGKLTSNAQTSADQAADAASRAGASANIARKDASDAASLALIAHQEADSARKSIKEASDELSLLRTDSQKLEAEANKTKSDLIDLAVCNAPRVIRGFRIGGGKMGQSYVDPLLPMAGQVVFIEVLPDAEARRAALSIAGTLVDAKWNVQKPLRFVDGLSDGVRVQTSAASLLSENSQIPNLSGGLHAWDVAEKLVDFLHSHNWRARRGLAVDANGKIIRDPKILPEGAIRIQIGLYPPAIYVSPPGMKAFDARMEESKQAREKFEAEEERRQLSGMPPVVRERLEKEQQQRQGIIKKEMSNVNGPCQVLNPLF